MENQTNEKLIYIFQTTPLRKIIFLSIVTFGIYDIIWCYGLWKSLINKTNYKANPFLRSIFAGIMNFTLFPLINDYLKKHEREGFSSVIFASLYLFMIMLSKLPEPYFLLSILAIFILVKIQKEINSVNKKFYPQEISNSWNVTNTIWAIICTPLFLISLLNCFIKF